MMRALHLDKTASVTINRDIRRDVRVSDEFPCQEGDVIAVRVIGSKSTYNTLELPTGRMSTLKSGDVIAGALGHRNALAGYAGRIPTSIKTGQIINLLNLGGVLGECTGYSPLVGPPYECEVLGQVLEFPDLGSRKGIPANIAAGIHSLDSKLRISDIPVVAVVGTCMNSGKTEACNTLIQQLARSGKRVAAGKTTGVSLRRDVLAMQDAGAQAISIFTDFGVVTTQRSNAPGLALSILNKLASSKPDVIVLELGDGLMGAYGVDAILENAELAKSFSSVVLAANDPVGAWGGAKILGDKYGMQLAAITGPATDNLAGCDVIEAACGISCVNARQSPERFALTAFKEAVVA